MTSIYTRYITSNEWNGHISELIIISIAMYLMIEQQLSIYTIQNKILDSEGSGSSSNEDTSIVLNKKKEVYANRLAILSAIEVVLHVIFTEDSTKKQQYITTIITATITIIITSIINWGVSSQTGEGIVIDTLNNLINNTKIRIGYVIFTIPIISLVSYTLLLIIQTVTMIFMLPVLLYKYFTNDTLIQSEKNNVDPT